MRKIGGFCTLRKIPKGIATRIRATRHVDKSAICDILLLATRKQVRVYPIIINDFPALSSKSKFSIPVFEFQFEKAFLQKEAHFSF